MLTVLKREAPNAEMDKMTIEELESEWDNAKGCFDQALAQKVMTDRVYVAAANRLNTIERLMKKIRQREATARRQTAKSHSLKA